MTADEKLDAICEGLGALRRELTGGRQAPRGNGLPKLVLGVAAAVAGAAIIAGASLFFGYNTRIAAVETRTEHVSDSRIVKIETKAENLADDVTEIKEQVTASNGKLDALLGRFRVRVPDEQ